MSILMGIMAVFMVIAFVSGRGHMMSGHEKAQQKQESMARDAQKEDHHCDDCPAVLDMIDKNSLKEDSPDKNKTDAEVIR